MRIHGHEIHVFERGEGPGLPVICVHSTGMSHLQWRRLARRLSKRHRVVAPDLLGYGQTDPWRGPGPFETRFDMELVATLVRESTTPVHLVGHSYGGRLVMGVAAEHADKVASIACFEPVCFGVLRSTEDAAGLRELAEFDADGQFLDDDFGGTPAWVERFVNYWNGDGAWRAMSEVQQATFLRSARKMFEEVRETSTEAVPHTTYTHLPCPALFISGSESTVAGRRCAAILAEVIEAGRHVEIEAGHMAPLLAADEVNALIMDHIAAVESARGA